MTDKIILITENDVNHKNVYLKNLHKELLDIMNFIHNTCQKLNIKYYIVGGTLLGAIRHQGFIPWDDDFDIAMPRKDYERLTTYMMSQNFKNFGFLSSESDPTYNLIFAKLYKKNTIFNELSYYGKFSHGIAVDIFPLDKVKKYSCFLNIKKRLNTILFALSISNNYAKKTRKFYVKIISKCIPTKFFKFMRNIFILNMNNKPYMFYANYGSQYSIKKQTFHKSYYGSGIMVKFNNFKYNAPNNYKEILKSIYGENYMEIPKKDKQRTHYPEEVIFSNGTHYKFIYDSKKISAKESIM